MSIIYYAVTWIDQLEKIYIYNRTVLDVYFIQLLYFQYLEYSILIYYLFFSVTYSGTVNA